MRGRPGSRAQLLALAGLASLLVGLFQLPVARPALRAQSLFACPPSVSKTAFPPQVLLGEPVTIKLSVRPEPQCQREVTRERPVQVVVAIDVSGSMSGQGIASMRNLAGAFVESLRLGEHPGTEIAIVSFNERAREHCSLTNDPNRLEICLRQVGGQASGGTDLGSAIQRAERILAKGRSHHRGQQVAQGIALLSDGGQGPCRDVSVQRGLHLAAVCTTEDCNEVCMSDLAKRSNGSYLESSQQDQLARIFTAMQLERLLVKPRDVRITDTLPVGYTVLEDTIDPRPWLHRRARPPQGQDTLVWRFDELPETGMTVSFQALPARLGMQAANHRAEVTVRDDLGLTGRAEFPIPYISVLGAPSPTPRHSPTATPTSTATSTPRPSAPPGTEPPPAREHFSWFPLLLSAIHNER